MVKNLIALFLTVAVIVLAWKVTVKLTNKWAM